MTTTTQNRFGRSFRGSQFSKFGPSGYALAHLADHKNHGNRYKTDFEVTVAEKSTPALFGLYTCLSNTVYTPVSLIKPPDFVGSIRSLLIRRAQQLYCEVCQAGALGTRRNGGRIQLSNPNPRPSISSIHLQWLSLRFELPK
jgi:hypothetical protein